MKPQGLAALVAVLVTGCATGVPARNDDPSRSGQVGMRDISAVIAPTARMQLADNESFLMPLDDSANAAPVYPDSLLARRLPAQVVCMRVSVGRDGGVSSSAPLVQAPECPGPDEVDAAFFGAASQAVAGWRFDPALRCVFPDARTKENTIASCGGFQEVPVPVSLTYRFVFEQKDGRGSVRGL
ncbi:MAG TPA: hypothetical protein VIT90_02590 [Lysobacter sp.]